MDAVNAACASLFGVRRQSVATTALSVVRDADALTMGFTSHRILLCLTADFIRLDLLIYLEFDHPSSYVIGQIFLTKSGKRLSGSAVPL